MREKTYVVCRYGGFIVLVNRHDFFYKHGLINASILWNNNYNDMQNIICENCPDMLVARCDLSLSNNDDIRCTVKKILSVMSKFIESSYSYMMIYKTHESAVVSSLSRFKSNHHGVQVVTSNILKSKSALLKFKALLSK